jgi:hypothetical protein
MKANIVSNGMDGVQKHQVVFISIGLVIAYSGDREHRF